MSDGGIEFFVLTGFLGSGKTTLLRDFLEQPEAADTAVIVNEVGEIGLDGIVLRDGGDSLPMAMLSNGCVCCQIGSDLAFTIDRLIVAKRPHGTPPLRRIILETSGLAKPGPVLRQLASLAEHRMKVAVVGTFDLTRGTETATFEEAVSQWAAAHRIAATKVDLASVNALSEAPATIAAINPLAEVIALKDRASTVATAFAPLVAAPPLPDVSADVKATHPRLVLCCARPVADISYPDLAAWLDNLAGALGDRLLWLKGLVQVKTLKQPLLIESVGTLFSPPRPLQMADGSQSSFLVIIAHDVMEAELGPIAPSGLFQFSSWQRPDAALRDERRVIKAEWVT